VSQQEIIGHGQFRYRVDTAWSKADPATHPVNNCHEMVQVPDGRLFMITDHLDNNILIYNTDGDLLDSWTLNMEKGHGLTLNIESGVPFLYICDTGGRVVKTDLLGEVLLEIPSPVSVNTYTANMDYMPTQTAISPNGDIYVADGYGSQYIIQYNKQGEFIRKFGGKSMLPTNKGKFYQAHGIALDTRGEKPLLVVSSRVRNEFQWFTLEGEYVKNAYLPGVYMSRPVINGDYLYAAVCMGTFPKDFRAWLKRGFVVILDKNNRVVSAPGAHQPQYDSDGQLEHLYQEKNIIDHGHDVCIDTVGDLYVLQWNAGQVYPFKYHKI